MGIGLCRAQMRSAYVRRPRGSIPVAHPQIAAARHLHGQSHSGISSSCRANWPIKKTASDLGNAYRRVFSKVAAISFASADLPLGYSALRRTLPRQEMAAPFETHPPFAIPQITRSFNRDQLPGTMMRCRCGFGRARWRAAAIGERRVMIPRVATVAADRICGAAKGLYSIHPTGTTS